MNYTRRSFSALLKENKNQYSLIFQNKFLFMVNMTSYNKYMNYTEKKLMNKANEILKSIPYSIENNSLNSEDVICQILDLEAIIQDLFQRVSDTNDLKFDDILSEQYEELFYELKHFYELVHNLSLNLQLLYNHIFVHIKNMYFDLRSEIEKNTINDFIFYKKCMSYYISLNFNFCDVSYNNVCKIITETLYLKNEIEKYNKIISYYDQRLEKTQEMWKSVEMEFFGIAYSPDIVKKTVWSEQEFNEYKNMLIC